MRARWRSRAGWWRRRWRRREVGFLSPTQTHLLPPPPPSQNSSSDLIKMLRSHFTLSVQGFIIRSDFWTASCAIRNPTAPGENVRFTLAPCDTTVYLPSPPQHSQPLTFSLHCLAFVLQHTVCMHNDQRFVDVISWGGFSPRFRRSHSAAGDAELATSTNSTRLMCTSRVEGAAKGIPAVKHTQDPRLL